MSLPAAGARTLDETPEAERPPSGEPILELPSPGDVIGRYRLRRLIGVGGMGVVYEAEHVVLEKRVAMKLLKPEIAVREDLRGRFVREGLAASKVQHPHVVDVTDAAEENGRAYLVMELLDGHGLDAELRRRGKLDIGRASEIILPICAALAEAHAVGVVHRDMKPENVVLVPSLGRIHPKVVDFGISDVIGAAGAAEAGVVLGTPHYMAPEQARGAVIDGHADQYAVAVMLFEMLTGELPYDPSVLDDGAAMIATAASGRVRRLRDVWPQAPAELDAALAKAMSLDAAARFATVERFGRALVPFASSRAVRRFRDLVDPGWSTMLPAVRDPSTDAAISPQLASAPTGPWDTHRADAVLLVATAPTLLGPPPAPPPLPVPVPAEEPMPTSGVRAIPSKLATLQWRAVTVVSPAPAVEPAPKAEVREAASSPAAPSAEEVHRVAAEPTLIVRMPTDAREPLPIWSPSTELMWLALAFLAVASIALGWLVSLLAR